MMGGQGLVVRSQVLVGDLSTSVDAAGNRGVSGTLVTPMLSHRDLS